MFSINFINEQREYFNLSTNYNIPKIDDTIYYNNEESFAFISHNEIKNNSYIIHVSSSLLESPKKFQIAVLWHEFTHISDFLYYKDGNLNILDIMKSYSEAHAENIKLRYLLDLKPNEKIIKSPD